MSYCITRRPSPACIQWQSLTVVMNRDPILSAGVSQLHSMVYWRHNSQLLTITVGRWRAYGSRWLTQSTATKRSTG